MRTHRKRLRLGSIDNPATVRARLSHSFSLKKPSVGRKRFRRTELSSFRYLVSRVTPHGDDTRWRCRTSTMPDVYGAAAGRGFLPSSLARHQRGERFVLVRHLRRDPLQSQRQRRPLPRRNPRSKRTPSLLNRSLHRNSSRQRSNWNCLRCRLRSLPPETQAPDLRC